MIVRALTVIAAVLLLAGCASATRSATDQPDTKPPATVTATAQRAVPSVTRADSAALADGNARFAGRLLAQLARTHSTLALSPFSISDALSMTYAGARVRTAEQMAAALDFRLPPARLAAAFNAQSQSLAKANRTGATLEVANALFGQSGQTFRQPFIAILARDYGAAMHTVDFANPDAVTQINAWVSDNTAGNIPHLFASGDVNALTRLVLADAVYLDAKWLSPFQPHGSLSTSCSPARASSSHCSRGSPRADRYACSTVLRPST